MWRSDSLEKTRMLGKIEGRRRRGQEGWDDWMASLTQWTWVWVDSGSWWRTGRPGLWQFMGSQTFGHDLATELNWTELKQSRLNSLTTDSLKLRMVQHSFFQPSDGVKVTLFGENCTVHFVFGSFPGSVMWGRRALATWTAMATAPSQSPGHRGRPLIHL